MLEKSLGGVYRVFCDVYMLIRRTMGHTREVFPFIQVHKHCMYIARKCAKVHTDD